MATSDENDGPGARRRYAAAVALSAAALGLRWLLDPWLGEAFPFVVAFTAIAAAAWYGGLGPGLLALGLGAAGSAFFFITPRLSFAVRSEYVPGVLAYVVSGLILVALAEQNRRAQLRAEREKREATRGREWLRVTLASLGDAVIAADPSGRVSFLNAEAEALTGWPAAEAVGRPIGEVFVIVNEVTRQAAENPALRALREGRVVGLANHTVLVDRNGAERPIDDSAAPIRDADGTVVGAVLVFRDVTESRRSAHALAESEATYRLLSEGLDQMVWVASADGGLVYANRHWFAYTGLTSAETLGRGWLAALQTDEAEVVGGQWERALQTGEGFDLEARFRRGSDGSYRWHLGRVRPVGVGDGGQPSRWLGTALDIEERRRSVEDLRASEERLRLAQEAGRTGTWDFDVPSRRVTWSPSLEAIHGLPPGAFPGTFEAYQRDIHPDDRARVLESIRRAVAGGLPHQAEYRLIWPDGSVHWVEARGRPFLDPAGRVYRMVGICMDVTERKRAEADLRQALGLAEEAGRAKDRFVAMLSHELRTPLAPVLLAAEELLADPATPQGHREALEVLRRNVELEVRLIDDLLDVTRVVHGKLQYRLEVVDAHALVLRTVDVCRADIDAQRIELVVDPGAAAHHVMADAARLQQVLWNVVKNAVKFTPSGGLVRVKTWDEGEPARLVIEVADTGLGIDAAALPRIFNAFEQVEDASTGRFGGLGLGLAISRAIVSAHGGTLTADSPGRNQGATFRVVLPVVAPAGAAAEAEVDGQAPARDAAPDRPLHVLLVEDDPVTARIMARLMRNNGYAVTTANTLAAARAVPADGIDLLVSDIALPDGNGLDLMRALAARGGVPGIALTGFGTEDDVRRCLEAGFVAHLTKPIDFTRLDAMIRRVAAEHAAAAVAPGARPARIAAEPRDGRPPRAEDG